MAVLTSWIQWPILVVGVAGCVVVLQAFIQARSVRDVRPLFRLMTVGRRMLVGAIVGLLIVDYGGIYVVGRSSLVGLYFTLGALTWMMLIYTPIMLRTQRIRREKGWQPVWLMDATEDEEVTQ